MDREAGPRLAISLGECPWQAGKLSGMSQGGHRQGSGARAPGGLTPPPPGPQLVEELEREQQSRQRLEGERRETEGNWEAQIADILSWWVPRAGGGGGAQAKLQAQP